MRENLFLFVAFYLGCCAVLSIDVFNTLFIFSLLLNIGYNPKAMWQHILKEKVYFLVSLLFIAYQIVLLTVTYHDVHPSYWIFETLVLSFLLVPLYMLSVKDIMTTRLLKQVLLSFTMGVIVFNVACLFQLTGGGIFTAPLETFEGLYQSRFGGNKHVFGGFVLLEPQALYLSIASIISYAMFLFEKDRFYKNIFMVLLPLCLLFLTLTVTKASMLGFMLGAGLLTYFYIRHNPLRLHTLIFAGIIAILISTPFLVPDAYAGRFADAGEEIENVLNGELKGGSIAPRVALLKEFAAHFDEFALKGLGVYSDNVTKQWYINSEYSIGNLNNIHNSFLEYWIIGGVPGLIFVLSFFFHPVYAMFKNRKCSFFILALLGTLVVTNSACALLLFNDSKALILFFLSLVYFYNTQITELTEKKSTLTYSNYIFS